MATTKKSPSKPASTKKPKVTVIHSLDASVALKPKAKVASVTSQTPAKDTFLRLRKWNLSLAALHAVQGVLVLILSTVNRFPVSTSYLTQDPLQTAAQGKPVLGLATHHLFDVNLAYVIAAFFIMSAIAHIVLATLYRKRYEAGLTVDINKVRWYEYALSASTMMIAIGLLVGIQDVALLVALFGGTAVMNLCGLVMETHNRPGKPVNWHSYIVGSIAGLVPWIIIAIYLLAGNLYGTSAPAFVYWIFVSIFIFFSCFAVNMWLQYKKIGKWADYLYGERVYMILSLVAKSLLAWQVFAGALRP